MTNKKNRLKGYAPPNKYSFRTDSGKLYSEQDQGSIFPIIKQRQVDGVFVLLGTGFFISTLGLFITARHVLKDAFNQRGEQQDAIGGLHLHVNKEFYLRTVVEAWFSGNTDLAVGLLEQRYHTQTNEPLTNNRLILTNKRPEFGSQVVTYAFPDSQILRKGASRTIHLRPNFYEGKIVEYFPNGRDRSMMPWPCYQTDIHIHGGASGGPVIDQSGLVFGINCSSMEPHTDISYVVPIDDFQNARIDNYRASPSEPPRRIQMSEFIETGQVALS